MQRQLRALDAIEREILQILFIMGGLSAFNGNSPAQNKGIGKTLQGLGICHRRRIRLTCHGTGFRTGNVVGTCQWKELSQFCCVNEYCALKAKECFAGKAVKDDALENIPLPLNLYGGGAHIERKHFVLYVGLQHLLCRTKSGARLETHAADPTIAGAEPVSFQSALQQWTIVFPNLSTQQIGRASC